MAFYNNVIAGAAGAGDAGYKIERSLRFNSADTAQLATRFLSFTDINTGTISFWIKRSGLGAGVIAAGWDGGVSYSGSIQFNSSDDTLQVSMGGSAAHTFKTNAALRDVSSWYHVVASWNRSASAADKVKVWINGVAQTSSDTGYQSWTSGDCQIWAANAGNRIGRGDADRYTNQLNGYLAEYHYVDGQALDETSFGKYDSNNVWQPKDCKDDLTYGTAGFYLSFNDTSSNSALGLDQSPGRTQDPTATTYGSITGGSVANVFDGVLGHTSELSLRPDGAGVTLDTPVTASSSVRIYGSSEGTANARYQINGTNTSAVPTTYPTRGWTTISGLTFPITINSFGIGGAQSNDGGRLSAIEIDGTVLTGTANNWTVGNMSAADGAPVSVSSAGGALPIRNTTGDLGGTAASGFRTDANASSLFLALPLNTNTSDVSNSINSNSTTKTTTNQSTATSSSQSKFYGASSYWNANSDGILVAESGSELVLGTGDFTIEFWFRDDSNHSGSGGRCYLFDNRIGGSVVGDPPTIIGYVDGSSTITYGSTGGGNISHNLSTDNKWIHFAAVRNSNTTNFYVNGTSVGSHTDNTNYTNNGFGIGRATDANYGWAGYIQDFRVYKTAKYTSNFSVPAGPDTSVGAACDSLIDSPTDYEAESGNNVGNYATLNALANSKFQSRPLTNGNLDFTGNTSASSGYPTAFSTIGMTSGKFYCEATVHNSTDNNGVYVGVCDKQMTTTEVAVASTYPGGPGGNAYSAHGKMEQNSSVISTGNGNYTGGDVIGIAYDADNGKLYFSKNGSFVNSADPAGGTNPNLSNITGEQFFVFGGYENRGLIVNFGQRPFAYSIPTGFKTLCTTNLPDPLIADPSTVFDVDTWNGDNSDPRSRTLSFGPDLVWIKTRNQTNWHSLTDSVRGAPKKLYSNSTNAEDTTPIYGQIDSLNSDGFTLGGGTDSSNPLSDSNQTGTSYVAWAWDAGSSNTTISAASLNSSIYDRSKVWSSLVTTSSLHSSYNAYGSTSKFGCFDGKRSTSMYSASGPLTITFNASAFPASGGPYFVEVETNQRGIKVNGQPSSGYTTDIAANQATYWANNGSVSSLQSIEVQQASNAYGGMCNRIRVNGKVLADSINTSVTWSNAITALANSSLTNPANGFDGNEGSYCDSTAGFTIDLSGHTFGTGTHTIELKSGGASSFTVNGTTSLSGSGSGAIVWSGTHTGELTSLTSSATGASIYYIKIDGEYLLDPGQDFVENYPAVASTCRTNQTAGFSIVSYTGTGSRGEIAHGLNAQPHFVVIKDRSAANAWAVQHVGTTLGTGLLKLNATDAVATNVPYPVWGSTAPTSSLFSVGTSSDTNGNGNNYIAYCFAPVDQYSAYGSYKSNNSTDGPFVYLGFQAKLIIWKNADAAHGWYMYDDTRNPNNPMSKYLAVHDNIVEGDPGGVMDVLSNGFKVRNTGADMNSGSHTILYMAWAETPFKTARAR